MKVALMEAALNGSQLTKPGLDSPSDLLFRIGQVDKIRGRCIFYNSLSFFDLPWRGPPSTHKLKSMCHLLCAAITMAQHIFKGFFYASLQPCYPNGYVHSGLSCPCCETSLQTNNLYPLLDRPVCPERLVQSQSRQLVHETKQQVAFTHIRMTELLVECEGRTGSHTTVANYFLTTSCLYLLVNQSCLQVLSLPPSLPTRAAMTCLTQGCMAG